MKHIILYLIFILFVLSSCSSSNDKKTNNPEQSSKVTMAANNPNLVTYPTLNDSLHRELMIQGGTHVHRAMFGIKTALAKAIMEKGPEYALEFCNVNAIPITDSIGQVMNVGVKRVAKKNRNPQNLTNDQENVIYKQYIMGYLQNQNPRARIEINKSGHPVYYKLIDVKPECMMCHGKPNVDISPNIAARIKQLYPNDKATDFKVGEPRGMWAITFNDILIKTQ
jgi:hypothetical protein